MTSVQLVFDSDLMPTSQHQQPSPAAVWRAGFFQRTILVFLHVVAHLLEITYTQYRLVLK